MNIFNYLLHKDNYLMYQFSKDHIYAAIASFIIAFIILLIPVFLKKKDKIKYFKFLGFLFLIVKVLEVYYRTYVEKFYFWEGLPLHSCNVLLIIGSLYLITKNKHFYGMVYYMFLTYVVVIFIPGSFEYSTHLYAYLFILMHMINIIIFLIGLIYLKEKPVSQDLYFSIVLYTILALFLRNILNPYLGTNFMYVNGYILPVVSFIKPMYLYAILLMVAIILSMLFMELINILFIKRKGR